MATSGLVQSLSFTLDMLLDQAFLKAGAKTSDQTAENVQTALREMNLWLSGMSNRGINLWCIERSLVPLYVGQVELLLPTGTIDVQQVNWRNYTRMTGSGTPTSSAGGTVLYAFDQEIDTACTQVSPGGYIEYDFLTDVSPTMIGWLSNSSGTLNLSLEYSTDNVVWAELQNFGSTTYVPGEWVWYDLLTIFSARYWRIKETGTGIIDVSEIVFANNTNDVPLYRMNRDEYATMPNKTFQGRPVQWWYDNRMSTQKILTWPLSNDTFKLLQVIRTRQIQDITDIKQQVEAPMRWWDTLCWAMAFRMNISGIGDPSRYPTLKDELKEALDLVEAEERDNSPISLLPNISGYTR